MAERTRILRVHQCHDTGQDQPADHVVECGARDRHPAQEGMEQVAFKQDARQHREGGDAHGGANEQGERQEIDPHRCQAGVHERGEGRPQAERHEGAGRGGDHYHAAHRLRRLRSRPHADDKHEQDQADLAERIQAGKSGGRKQGRKLRGHQEPKQGRAEHQSRHHFADDCGLVEPNEDRTDDPRRDQDNCDLKQQNHRWRHSRTVQSSPIKVGFDRFRPISYNERFLPLLGGRSTVGQRTLTPLIGVRIPASQPSNLFAAFAKYFEWGGQNLDGSWGFTARRPGWEKPIHQLFVDTGVTIWFHGHDHLYAREVVDGVIYQSVPQPSTARYQGPDLAREYGYLATPGETAFVTPGHVRVSVNRDTVGVAFLRAVAPGQETAALQNRAVVTEYTVR
jgi:hypothetical protein